MTDLSVTLSLLILGALSLAIYSCLKTGRREAGLPPGPPTMPIFGNLLDFPTKWPHYRFSEWARVYGDIFSLKIVDKTVIVLNSPTAVKEVIDQHSASTANRPASIIADLITPDNMNIGTGRFANETWKTLRKATTMFLRQEVIDGYKPYQRAEAAQLMWDMLRAPEGFYDHICRYTTSFILGSVYGQRAPRYETVEARLATEVQLDFMYALELGKMPPVDIFPFLNWIPERFAEWKRKVASVRQRHEALYGTLLERVKNRLRRGESTGAFLEDAYMRRKEWGLSESMLRNLGGGLLQASDTSSAVLQNVVLLLTAYPDAQRRLQEEIDRVVGHDRAPTWEDIPHLPYMKAFIEECLRFRPVGPLAIPHAMTQDEWINGMFFPKDAVVFINLWAIFHDPSYYDKPEQFNPERFLAHPLGVKLDRVDDPARRENMTFGAGRRACPGLRSARAGLDINVANFAWAFDFTAAKDPLTNCLTPPSLWKHTEGVNMTPLPFECTITPRPNKSNLIYGHFLDQARQYFSVYEKELLGEDREFVRSRCADP